MNNRMKMVLFVITGIFLVSLSATAVVPKRIPVQGMLMNAKGEPLDGEHDLTFSISDAYKDGTELWSEVQTDVAVDNGFFTVHLGSVEELPLGAIREAPEVWLSLGVGKEVLSPVRLGSVPFALEAETAHQVGGFGEGDIQPILSAENGCIEGEYFRGWDGLLGEPICAPDEVGESGVLNLQAGDGIEVDSTEPSAPVVSVADGVFQPILDTTCSDNEYVKSINPATGEVSCVTPPDVDSFAAITCSESGDVLVWNGTTWLCNSAMATEAYADAAVATLTARLNDGSNTTTPVGWSDLSGVPAGFSDGTDANTTYTAGTGLSLTGSTFSAKGSPYANVVVVAESGGDYTSIQDGVDALVAMGASSGLVKVMPGTYNESVIINNWYVNIEGSGEDVTKITSDIGTDAPIPSFGTITYSGADFGFLKDITVENTGCTNTSCAAIKMNGGGNLINFERVTAITWGANATNAYGMVFHSLNSDTIHSDLKDVWVVVNDGSGNNFGILTMGNDIYLRLIDSQITTGDGGLCHAVHLKANNGLSLVRTNLSSSGGTEGIGLYMEEGSLWASHSEIEGWKYGIRHVDPGSTERLQLKLSTLWGDYSYDSSNLTCYGMVHESTGQFYSNTCPASSD